LKIGFGLFDHLEWPEKKDYDTMLKEKFEIVKLADKLGCFDTFSVLRGISQGFLQTHHRAFSFLLFLRLHQESDLVHWSMCCH
jgi:hypothetical protein